MIYAIKPFRGETGAKLFALIDGDGKTLTVTTTVQAAAMLIDLLGDEEVAA